MSQKKYLDDDGLLYVKQKIADKFVAKETGKGLSSNDYTTTEKNKLAGLENYDDSKIVADIASLQTSVGNKVDKVAGKGLSTNDFTNELKQTYDDTVETVAGIVAEGGEPNVIEIVKVNGTALTPDANKAVNVSVPTKTSDLTNDSNFAVDSSYVHTDNNFTTTLKNKLNGISAGAEVNAINTIKVNGTAQTITSKAVNISVPTNNNQLTNGAGYQTASDVNTAINNKIGSTYKPKGSVAFANLPALSSSNEGFVYNITDSFTTTADFVEGAGKKYPAGTNVVIINTSGTTYKYDVLAGVTDLSGYVKEEDLVAITNAEIDTIFA